MKNWIFIGLAILLLVGCTQNSDRTLTTQGTSTISVPPDEAEIYLNVQTSSESADDAREENAAIVEKVKEALKDEMIESQNFNIYEDFDYTESGRKSRGFIATHTLKVSTTNFENVGEIIDVGVKAGVTSINGVNFLLSKETEESVRTQALKEASQNAKSKAEAIAEGLDMSVGEVKAVRDSQFNYYPTPYYREMDAAMAVSEMAKTTSITPQDLEVSAQVEVVYTLK